MRPPKSLLKDSHPDLAKQVVDKSLLPTLSTGADKKIEWEGPCGHRWFASVYNRTNAKLSTGCPICNGKQILIGFNDLATTNPEIAKMCKNPDDAYTVTAQSNKKLEWQCDKGHVWMAPVSRLTVQGSGCPYCSGRLAIDAENDLLTLYPSLAKELKDKSLARTLKVYSNKRVEWQCSVDSSHVWITSVYDRTMHKTGCPYCSGRFIIPGVNDIATLYPDLIKSLDNPDDAYKYGIGSNVKLLWHCDDYFDHTWFSTPYNRLHGGCPICDGKQVLPGFNDLATTNPEMIKELVDKSIATQVTAGSGKKVEWQCDKGHRWFATVYHRVKSVSPTGCPVCNPTGTSRAEQEVCNIIKQLVPNHTVLTNDTSILSDRMELDVVVPDLHIAIEYNGMRWHSDLTNKPNNYHLKKSRLCHDKGYTLIHIWEDDWLDRKDIVIRMLATKLHAIDRLGDVCNDATDDMLSTAYARKLVIKIVSSSDAKVFLRNNHIQGFVTASFHFGLYDDNNHLRALLSVRSPKNNARMKRNDGEWEIQRYATCGHVPGGFTKLMNFAEQYIRQQGFVLTTWISFSDNSISEGNMYEKAGFVIGKVLPPDYKYVGDYTKWRRQPKERFQRKCFRDNPNLVWDESWTERQAAENNELYRIYDTGKIKWVKYVV